MKSPCFRCGKITAHLAHETPWCSVGCAFDVHPQPESEREKGPGPTLPESVWIVVCRNGRTGEPMISTVTMGGARSEWVDEVAGMAQGRYVLAPDPERAALVEAVLAMARQVYAAGAIAEWFDAEHDGLLDALRRLEAHDAKGEAGR